MPLATFPHAWRHLLVPSEELTQVPDDVETHHATRQPFRTGVAKLVFAPEVPDDPVAEEADAGTFDDDDDNGGVR